MTLDPLDITVVIGSIVAAMALALWFAVAADRARCERDDIRDRIGDLGEAHAETRRQLQIATVRLSLAHQPPAHAKGQRWPVCRCGRGRRAHVNGKHAERTPGACVASNCPRYEACS